MILKKEKAESFCACAAKGIATEAQKHRKESDMFFILCKFYFLYKIQSSYSSSPFSPLGDRGSGL